MSSFVGLMTVQTLNDLIFTICNLNLSKLLLLAGYALITRLKNSINKLHVILAPGW